MRHQMRGRSKRMDKPITATIEDSTDLYCPTCGKPRDDIEDTNDHVFKTLSCGNCGEALGTGIILGLKVVCPKCDMMVVMG